MDAFLPTIQNYKIVEENGWVSQNVSKNICIIITFSVSMGNHMIASTIKNLHCSWYLKIVLKLHKTLGESEIWHNFQISQVV